MFGITWPYVLGSAAVVLVANSVFWYSYGNAHGSNASALAAIQRQLDQTNAELKAQKAKDEIELPAEKKRLDEAFDQAAAALLKLGKCPATKEAANILNGVR